MARFRYIGAPEFSDADELQYFGTTFYKGEVSEVDEVYAAKLGRMTAFEKVEDDAPLNKHAQEAAKAKEAAEKAAEKGEAEDKPKGRTKPKVDLSGEDADDDDDDEKSEYSGKPTFSKGGFRK